MPRFLGPYRIEERLGAGGMGEVYRAFDDRLRRRVAIKHVLPERASTKAKARFRREARAVASLSHSAIVQIFDVLEEKGGDWIVMEHVEGSTVAALLDEGPLVLAKALAIGCDVAEGLAEAHEEGIVHRDLKTQNVMVTPKGRAKLLDFGLAKFVQDQVDDDPRITVDGEILGTWRAMSPEQVRGQDVGPRSDLFSLGTMIYEMITARSPFLADGRIETIGRILEHEPLSVRQMRPDVPVELSDLVDRLLEKAPADRPGSARLVAAELAAIAESNRRMYADEELAALEVPSARPTAKEASATALAESPSTSGPGERRQVTVMSCELGPVTGEEPLDPEEQLQMMPAFERVVRRVLQTYGGRVEPESAMSKSLTVLFGYPKANADDPQRAALGALGIVKEFLAERRSFERPETGRLTVRIGIHTGTAVAAAVPGAESRQLVLGETLNFASHIGSLAEPDTAAVSDATFKLLRDSFTFQTRSASLPGDRGPILFHRILEESDTTRFEEVGLVRLVAQVSRTQELEQILERWKLAREGVGQVVLVSGEAGIGKTRLVKSLKARLAEYPRNLVECRCSPYHRNTAFFPLFDFLQRVVAGEDWLREHETMKWMSTVTEEKETSMSQSGAERLESLFEDLPLARFLPRLAAQLRAPRMSRSQPLGHNPEAQKLKVLESLVALLSEMAEDLPVVFVVEDLHWIDPSTLELLTLLIDQVPTARMLVVLSFRRSFQPPWSYPYPSYLTHITLTRLHDEEVEILIDLLAEGTTVPPPIRREIVRRADGIPLFVEELTRLVLDAGQDDDSGSVGMTPAPTIPATLQGWLTARLDGLGSARGVAQLASALGREFSYELLREVSPLKDAELQQELDRLVEAELLHRRGLQPRVTYTFKHGLLRDAAHESMLRRSRKSHHRRIARVLVDRFPETVEEEPEILAYHYTEADLPAEAVACWRRASESAVRAANHVEACDHARRGLQILEKLPVDAVRCEHEMALRTFLGLALSTASGYHAPEVEQAYERARELWPRAEKSPHLFPIFDTLVLYYISRGQQSVAREMAQELLRLAEEAHDVDFLPVAHWSLGFVLLMQGEFAASRYHSEEGIAFHATQLSLEPNLPAGTGIAASTSLGDLSWSLWFLGYPDQARKLIHQSLEMIRQAPDAYVRAFSLFRVGYLHVFLRDSATVLELAEELIAFSNERGFLYFVAMGMFLKGQALAARGQEDEGLALMSGGLDGMWTTGRATGRPRNLALLAEACARTDLGEQGLSLLREASAAVEETGERHFEAEICRLRGELLLRRSASPEEVEEHFQRSLDVARSQGSKSLELRAAMSLCRLRRSQDRSAEARGLLSEVYGWFTEGLETADLAEARSLLESL